MNYCNKCKVKIENNTSTCPLCHQTVVNNNEDNTEENFPNKILFIDKRLRSANKIISFIFITVLFLNLLINIKTNFSNKWLLFAILPLTYLFLIIKVQIENRKNVAITLFLNVIMSCLVIFTVDKLNTNTLWSIKIVIPLILTALLLVYDFLSFIKKSFLFDMVPYLFVTSIISIILGLYLYFKGFVLWTCITMLFIAFSNLLGLIMFSNKKVMIELKMKFHV